MDNYKKISLLHDNVFAFKASNIIIVGEIFINRAGAAGGNSPIFLDLQFLGFLLHF